MEEYVFIYNINNKKIIKNVFLNQNQTEDKLQIQLKIRRSDNHED